MTHEDTLRGRKHYHDNQREAIKQHGADELVAAGEPRQDPRQNRERMGVDDNHKTRKMKASGRGTFP